MLNIIFSMMQLPLGSLTSIMIEDYCNGLEQFCGNLRRIQIQSLHPLFDIIALQYLTLVSYTNRKIRLAAYFLISVQISPNDTICITSISNWHKILVQLKSVNIQALFYTRYFTGILIHINIQALFLSHKYPSMSKYTKIENLR